MGDTFHVEPAVFRGHAVEHSIESWGAMALDAGIAPEGKVGSSLVSTFWGEPQNCLQVEAAFYGWRTPGIAGSIAPAQADAEPAGRAVGEAGQAGAPAAIRFGGGKAGGPG